MKNLPIYPSDEGWSCNEASYDPSEDFALILEEARKNNEIKTKFHSQPIKTNDVETPKRKKKSWKNSLSFLWWKPDKKSSAQKEEQRKKKNSSHSGPPVFGGRGGNSAVLRRNMPRRPMSEPLAAYFAPTKEWETENPYMWLGSRNYPSCSHAFGPIYLVT